MANGGNIFKDQFIAAATLDRILHHCATVYIKGDNYRLKERKLQGLLPQSSPGREGRRYLCLVAYMSY
jgi:hypothetical protein